MSQIFKEYYLEIAGFVIKIIFHNTEWIFFRNKFISDFLNLYGGFLSKNIQPKTDFIIDYVWSIKTNYIFKNNAYYSILYADTGKNKAKYFYQKSLVDQDFMFGRILNKLLSRHKGFILHASCAEINGKAYVFSGKSGSGKSTIAKMLDNKFRFFSDETVIVRKMGKRFYLFQSPFMENAKNHLKSSKKLMIEKFFLIEKSSLTQVKKIKDKKLVLKHLFTERRAEKKYYKRQVETIIDFVENNQFYKLKFTKDKKSLNKILEDLSAASPTAGTAPHTSTATSTA